MTPPKPQFSYVIDYFRKLYHLPEEIEIGHGTQNKKINIALGNWDYFQSLQMFPGNQVIWKGWHDRKIPFLFDGDSSLPVFEKRAEKVFVHYDLIASAFFFLSGWQEYAYRKNRPVYRFPFDASLQSQLNIAHIPVVNYYFDILRAAIESVYRIQLDREVFTKPVLCLTHDIDRTNSGWKEDGFSVFKKGNVSALIKLLAKRIFANDSWFNLEEILTLEKKYGAKSSFYFLPQKGRKLFKNFLHHFQKTPPSYFWQNADYDVRKKAFREIFRKIEDAGSEVGLHGSFGSHLHIELLQKDIDQLNVPVTGNRFHNLLFDWPKTFSVLENCGLKYDFTLGFAEETGFRNGTVFPFRPFNFDKNLPYNIIEIPLMVMDTTFRNYKKTPFPEILPEIKTLLKEVQKFKGVFTVLWHNNYFSPYKFAGWKGIYEELLNLAQRNGLDLLTANEVYERFTQTD